MTKQAKTATQAYREAVRKQASMSAETQWTMGEEIKRLKAAAYVEMEHDRLFRK